MMIVIKTVAALGGLYLALLIAYTLGQSDVRKSTVVEFGSPIYSGVFHGTCQTELYFNGQRGTACATDGRRNKDGSQK